MNRLTSLNRNSLAVAALCAAGFAAVPPVAGAQCASSGCNQETRHWANFGFHEEAQDARVGMILLSGKYYPAMCNGSGATPQLLGVDSTVAYNTPQLQAHSSFCMGGGNDKWTAIEDPITCAAGPALNVVYPIDNNGYRLTISGEGGNDTMSIGIGIGDAVGSVGEHGMCGGSGDDRMTGGYDPQIIYGHSGHDYMYGGRQNDTLRGSTGQDVALHPSNEQTDLIQTEGDVDCVYINGPVQSGSSCGTGADRYDVDGSTMSSCGTSTPDCCSISPAC